MPESHAAWEGQAETAAAVFPVHQQKMEAMTHKELIEEFRITDTLTDLQLEKLVTIHKYLFYKQWSEATHYSTLLGAREATRLARQDLAFAEEYVAELVQKHKDLADFK